MRIALVVAMAENGIIGRDGAMPWKLKTDLQAFRRITMNKPLVMGRKTFESLPGPLAGRDNIVVTGQKDYDASGIIACNSIEAALQEAGHCAARRGADEICVIGGAKVYDACLASAGRIYLTLVHAAPEGDTAFPRFDRRDWVEISRHFVAASEHDSADMSFVILDKNPAKA